MARQPTVIKANAKQLLMRYEALKSERKTWDSVWQEQVDYFMPNRPSISTVRQQGTKRTEKLFDSTALDCVSRLSASMAGNLTPSGTKWFYLKMRENDLNEDHETRDWLEDCAKRIRQAYNQSNFNSEIGELYPDIITFGTGNMFQESRPQVGGKFGGLTFRTYGPGTYVIDEDYDGLVDTVFREFKLSARIALKTWGEQVKESLKLRSALETPSKRDTRFTFIQCVYPRDKYKTGKVVNKNEMRYASVYICYDDQKIVEEGGYHEFPAVIPRWSKSSDEVYGRGLGHLSLPDVKTLNRAKELGLQSWAMEIRPPVLVRDNGVVGNVKLTPGGQTVISGAGGGPLSDSLAPLDLKIRHDGNRFNLDMLIQSIRSIFFVDQLRMKDSPQMTAEEVRARMDLMYRVLGPTVMGRLEKELLSRQIERTFAIMLREGALDEPPEAVIEAYRNNEADIDIEYEGPLARAQRNVEVEAIDLYLAGALPLSELGIEEPMDVLNLPKTFQHKAKILGVPESVMASEDEITQKGEARAQAQQKAAEAEQGALNAASAVDETKAAETAANIPPPNVQPVPVQ